MNKNVKDSERAAASARRKEEQARDGVIAMAEYQAEIKAERAKTEKMKIAAADPGQPWTDYTVTSLLSGKSYRVALRSLERGPSYCSCPDFRSNTLGTCKHILHVQAKVKRKFDVRALNKPYRRKRIAVHLAYDGEATLRVAVPATRQTNQPASDTR